MTQLFTRLGQTTPWGPEKRREVYLKHHRSGDPTEFEAKILRDLHDNGMSTSIEISERIGHHYKACGAGAHRLTSKGLVVRRVPAGETAPVWQISDLAIELGYVP